ncbi:MAG: hypothetical protein KGJ08_03480 [Gammaproteobacteria bacterium]|nr:hypothetical protein [Gammaproteobacteria bacterium]
MLKQPIYMFQSLATAFTLSITLCTPLMAMGGYASDQVGKGLIQGINYQHHSITVNGQTYTVSPNAKFSGVAAFSVLSIGMPIQFMLGTTSSSVTPGDAVTTRAASSQPQVIMGITWLPGGIK